MAFGRSDAAAYLAGSLAELLTDAGLGTSDEPGELKEVIDRALLMTGTAYADLAAATVADADVLGFLAVLDYAALLRIDAARGDRASSISIDGPNTSKSWNRSAWADRLKQAKADAAPFLVGSGQWGSGSLVLGDWIEPVVTYGD